MKNSVKNEDAHFVGELASETLGILPSNRRRDGNVAPVRHGTSIARFHRVSLAGPLGKSLLYTWLIRCERQYIGGLVFTTVRAIPLGDVGAGDQADGNRIGWNFQELAQSGREFFQVINGNGDLALAV